MKNIICVTLALFCIIHISKQDTISSLERLVDVEKKSAEILSNKIGFFEKEIKQNIELKVNEIKNDTLININNIINEALENATLSIEKGKKEGKIVDECYDNAKNNLEATYKNANNELTTCIQKIDTTMEAPLRDVATNIEAVNTLLTSLDAIMPNCHSSNVIKMQTCVMKNLYSSRSTLKQLDNDAKNVMRAALIAQAVAIGDVRSCTTKLVVIIRTSSIEITVDTDNCVRNAPTTPLTTNAPRTTDAPLTTDAPRTTDAPLTTTSLY